MTLKPVLTLASLGVIALAACTPTTGTDPYYGTTQQSGTLGPRAQNGAIIGGMVGALAGAQADNDKLGHAVVGGLLGAAIGGAIGNGLDQQAAELSGINSNFNVTNHGDYLVVNMPQDVLFGIDSAALRPDLRADIASIAQNLIRYPNSQIQIIGHTDNSGTAAYNQDLSQRRAVSVADVLRASGVPAGRIAAFGRGEDQPIASNLTDQGRAQNRRVEIIIRPNV